MRTPKRLTVFLSSEPIGSLTTKNGTDLSFSYSDAYLRKEKKIPLSLSLPYTKNIFSKQTSTNFFLNLLPEEHQYRKVCLKNDIDESDYFRFLQKFGHDCCGAICLSEKDSLPSRYDSNAYRDITQILEKYSYIDERNLIAETQAPIAIAGSQDKLAVYFTDTSILLPCAESFAPTNAIIKPPSVYNKDLHKNEYFCMTFAQRIGLPVPETKLLSIGETVYYLVFRYDRKEEDTLRRIHQEDFCQALALPPQKKYQAEGGPSFSQCAAILRHPSCENAQQNIRLFIQYIIFIYSIGNCDAHGKNFSLLYSPTGTLTLAPLYDLISTTVYKNISPNLAMAFGDVWDINDITEAAWKKLARCLSVRYEEIRDQIESLLTKSMPVFERLLHEQSLAYGECALYDQLFQQIPERCKRLESLL